MYSILITISFFDIVNVGFLVYLWSKLYYDTPLLTYEYPVAVASAPIKE